MSPFASPRSSPRRPDIGDTRPFTRQARNVVGLVPLVMGILGAVINRGLFTFWTGLALAGAVVTCEYTLSLRFEARHLDETRDFWRDHEATMRPRAFVANAVGFIVTGAGLATALGLGDFQAAGFFLPVAFLSGSCVLLMWGQGPVAGNARLPQGGDRPHRAALRFGTLRGCRLPRGTVAFVSETQSWRTAAAVRYAADTPSGSCRSPGCPKVAWDRARIAAPGSLATRSMHRPATTALVSCSSRPSRARPLWSSVAASANTSRAISRSTSGRAWATASAVAMNGSKAGPCVLGGMPRGSQRARPSASG